jgi:hypothetical protein
MHQEEHIIKKIEHPKAIVAMRDDGIVHVYYKKGILLDFQMQLELLEIFNEITDKASPFIFEAASGVRITKEARNKATTLEDRFPCSCSAIYAQNYFFLVIGNFFAKIKRPKTPYRVFTSFPDAIEWIKKVKSI